MRVVLDTNVFVSGIFWKGPPAKILAAWRDGRIELIVSPAIWDEYQRVAEELNRMFTGIELDPILDLLAVNARMVADRRLPEPVCSDPADDKFIAAGLIAEAACVVSGDKALLKVDTYGGLRIVRPAEFVRVFLPRA